MLGFITFEVWNVETNVLATLADKSKCETFIRTKYYPAILQSI